ncbi:MAG: polymer-forming cytoskeletal protein [Schwartzia sp.]|nr:polymer-forming cytoskeletal protein [Schwartzia sp. (in: firmicutes)]
MFGSVKKHIDAPGEIETIIGSDTFIKGQIGGSGSLRVDGRVEGGIEVANYVVIGESGCVCGDINAKGLTISGKVTGNVNCDGQLRIQSTGQLVGDVRVQSLNVADGGIFRGRSEMTTREEAGEEAAPQPAM